MAAEKLFFKGLTPELVKKAEEELDENPQSRLNGLRELREIIIGKRDIHCNFDDEYLLRFLRVKKFNIQKAYNMLRNHVHLFQRYSGNYTCKLPSEVWEAMNMHVISVLPERLDDFSIVVLFRVGQIDLSIAPVDTLIACVLTWSLIILDYEVTQISGFHLIIDFTDSNFWHYRPFANLPFVKLFIRVLQDCTPIRLSGVHLVHEPVVFRTLINVAKYLITKKIRERVHCHGNNLGALHDIIQKDLLPPWLGGTTSLINNEDATQFFLQQELLVQKLKRQLLMKVETSGNNSNESDA